MTKGFFRERKHYSLQEITDNLISINMEETRRIVGILKKYGVVKAVKKIGRILMIYQMKILS